jgi:hypothetical protein
LKLSNEAELFAGILVDKSVHLPPVPVPSPERYSYFHKDDHVLPLKKV